MFIRTLGLSCLLFTSVSSIASAQVVVQSPLRTAIEDCLNEAVSDIPMQLEKVHIDATADSLLVIRCDQQSAQRLFNAIAPYGKQKEPSKDQGGKTIIWRSLADGWTVCGRTIYDASGASVDRYTCFFILDVGDKALAAM